MDSAFMDYYIPALKNSGGYNDIYESLDSADLADIVRVAVEAINKFQRVSSVNKTTKSTEESIKLREQGNVHYVNRDYKKALLCYNKALVFAPFNSLDFLKAYSNSSAVLHAIEAYKDCYLIIDICTDLGCPLYLKEKLEKRKIECCKFIRYELATESFLRHDKFINEFVDFKVRRNTEVPCASDDVCVINIDGTKKVVAARDIKAGTMVAMERAFVSTLTDQNQYTSCYYCHRMCFFLLPCKGCHHALFCSMLCMNNCMEEYHRIECQILNRLGSVYDKPEIKLMTRAAIKLSLKLGWKDLSVASQEIGTERLKKSTVNDAFDVRNPLSMLSYDDQKAVFPGKIFNGSIICGLIVRCLSTVPDYFPEDPEKRKEAIDAMSRIMLHLYATFTNRVEIICSALDMKTRLYKCGIQRNLGWFSFTSKLAHSCEPNLFVLGLNDEVALVALQRIKKGDELTISYVDQFYDTKVTYKCQDESFWHLWSSHLIRQKMIVNSIHYLCECRVCVEGWHANSHIAGKALTRQQKKTFDGIMNTADQHTAGDKLNAANMALDFLTGLTNTTAHKTAYDAFRSQLNICQCTKILNKTYESSSFVNLSSTNI